MRGHLLVIKLMPTVTNPYTAMATRGFHGSSSSVAISAAMEPMVIPVI